MAKIKKNGGRPEVEVMKAGPLGGAVIPMEGDRDYSSETIKNELAALDIPAEEKVTVKNPVTGKESEITIYRDGTPDSKLMLALSDPNLNRDQKDQVVSMYLWERGKESSSMMVDLMRYKGTHTKETRAFTSQMRFDFELFVTMFTQYLESTSKFMMSELWYTEEDTKKLEEDYIAFVKDAKENNRSVRLLDYFIKTGGIAGPEKCALIQQALQMRAEAQILRSTTKKITEARMKEKGFGIYIGTDGRPYSMFGGDKEVEDAVAQDRERIEELKKDLEKDK